LIAFEATKAKEPNRFHGYAGAAQAAARLGDREKARENYRKLLALTSDADTDRVEVMAARKFMDSD
jgi:predicted Zn-dependent protease